MIRVYNFTVGYRRITHHSKRWVSQKTFYPTYRALPEDDNDFATRIRIMKAGFSRQIPKTESIKKSRISKQERGIWQRRYWEHSIRDQTDYERHVDYIHYNPVKHNYVNNAVDCEYSTIHRYIEKGLVSQDWASSTDQSIDDTFGER